MIIYYYSRSQSAHCTCQTSYPPITKKGNLELVAKFQVYNYKNLKLTWITHITHRIGYYEKTEWFNVFNYLETNQKTCFLDFGETFIKCIDILSCFRSRIN